MPSATGSDGESWSGHGRARAVAEAVGEACAAASAGRQRVAVAFSGGLDSSLLALLLSRRMKVSLYVAGRDGCHDFRAAEGAAELLGLPLTRVEMGEAEVSEAARRIASAVEGAAPIEVAVLVPLAAVCGRCSEEAVVTGAGADELFGGYARYARAGPAEGAAMMWRDYESLKSRGAVSERSLCESFGKAALQPFMATGVEAAAKAAGPEAHFSKAARKPLLRAAAAEAGLPEELAARPKKAAQYGSGSARTLARLAARAKARDG